MMLDKDQVEGWEGEPEKAGGRKPAKPSTGAPKANAPKPEKPTAMMTTPVEPSAPPPPAKPAEPAPSPIGEAFYTGETVRLTPEQDKARRRRGYWIAIGLFAFVIVVFALTMTKMGANILVRDL